MYNFPMTEDEDESDADDELSDVGDSWEKSEVSALRGCSLVHPRNSCLTVFCYGTSLVVSGTEPLSTICTLTRCCF